MMIVTVKRGGMVLLQIEQIGEVTEALTAADVNVLLVIVMLVIAVGAGVGGVMIARVLAMIGHALTEISQAFGGISQNTSELSSTNRTMRDLLERIEDQGRQHGANLGIVQAAVEDGRDAAKGGRDDIAEVQRTLKLGLDETRAEIGAVNMTLRTQYPNIMERLDKLHETLTEAQVKHAEREKVIEQRYERAIEMQQEADAQRTANDRAYREKLEAVTMAIGALRAYLEQRVPQLTMSTEESEA